MIVVGDMDRAVLLESWNVNGYNPCRSVVVVVACRRLVLAHFLFNILPTLGAMSNSPTGCGVYA